MKTKAEIRKEVKNLILENQQKLALYSDSICTSILQSFEYKNAQIILSYMALPDEVDLQKVMVQSLKDRKTVAVPKVYVETMTMDFFYLENDTAHMKEGYCQIPEPDESCQKFLPQSLKDEKILVLVPGRAFTKEGLRLGRGKGFYDKYLSRLLTVTKKENVFLCGIGFGFQIFPELPGEEFDIGVDKVFY